MFTETELNEMYTAAAKLGAHIALVREGIQPKLNEKELLKHFLAIGDILNTKIKEPCTY